MEGGRWLASCSANGACLLQEKQWGTGLLQPPLLILMVSLHLRLPLCFCHLAAPWEATPRVKRLPCKGGFKPWQHLQVQQSKIPA